MSVPICIDCNQPHRLIVMIESSVWESICPEDGRLCITCIESRLRAKQLKAKATFSYISDVLDASNPTTIDFAVERSYIKTWQGMVHSVNAENRKLKGKG